MKWLKSSDRYSTGERLFIGKICVGGYSWKTLNNQDNWHGFVCNIPELQGKISSNDVEEVKKMVEEKVLKVVNYLVDNLKKEK